jgi:Ca-activated chloride channel family protein
MTFSWPWMLATLGVLPVLVAGYRRLLRRRAARRAELAALGLVAPAAVASRRRHVAPVLMLCSLALLLVALARPQATVGTPRREGTVVLAFDASNSMRATDLAPTRMEAAKVAARTFVAKQPPTIRIAVVGFGDSGLVMQQPTTDRARVLAAIDRLTPQGGTSLGRGIQTALSAIAGRTVQISGDDGSVEPPGQDLGFHGSAAVVLLTDGQNRDGPDPIEVAQVASTAGVRVYPIGIGSPQGTVLSIDGFQVATALDEATLRQIATTTDGAYFGAADAQALTKVYDAIDLKWTVLAERVEVTGLLAGAAALLLLVGSSLSLAWFGRVI